MSERTKTTRRSLLMSGLGLLGGSVLLPTSLTGTAAAAESDNTWRSDTTANGWPVVAPPLPSKVEGSPVAVSLLPGPVSTVLLYCARRYFYEIDDTAGQGDIVGFSNERQVSADFESNHLSATALAFRPSWYPLGTQGGFLARDTVIIRDILADCEGTVRWGGDLTPVKESHFQIDVGPRDRLLQQVADKLTRQHILPGQGAGSALDPFSPDRQRTAKTLANRQGRR